MTRVNITRRNDHEADQVEAMTTSSSKWNLKALVIQLLPPSWVPAGWGEVREWTEEDEALVRWVRGDHRPMRVVEVSPTTVTPVEFPELAERRHAALRRPPWRWLVIRLGSCQP